MGELAVFLGEHRILTVTIKNDVKVRSQNRKGSLAKSGQTSHPLKSESETWLQKIESWLLVRPFGRVEWRAKRLPEISCVTAIDRNDEGA